MNNFTFYSPTYFVFGRDTEALSGEYVKKFGGTNVLIHYGGESAKKSGLLDRVTASLSALNISYTLLGGVVPNPLSGLVYEGISIVKEKNIDFILAVGGGSVIDSAKAIALGGKYDGDFWDFYSGKATFSDAVPVGTVLTIPAAGSEGSGDSVITHENGNLKRFTGGDALRPRFSILNPELTKTLPKNQIAYGVCDIMAHVFERYFSNTKNCEVTTSLCESLLKTLISEAPKAISGGFDYDSMANIIWAGMVAHNNIVGVGRDQDWSSHVIEHELSSLYGIAHGAGLAVVFPGWMKFVYKHDLDLFARFAKNVFSITEEDKEKAALLAIESLQKFWKSIGLPSNFSELGAKEEDIPTLAENIGLEGGMLGAFVPLSQKDAESVLKLCL